MVRWLVFTWILVWSLELKSEMRQEEGLDVQAWQRAGRLRLVSQVVEEYGTLEISLQSWNGVLFSKREPDVLHLWWWEPQSKWAYAFAPGNQSNQKELPPGRWILYIPPGVGYLDKIWISISGDRGSNWILGLKKKNT